MFDWMKCFSSGKMDDQTCSVNSFGDQSFCGKQWFEYFKSNESISSEITRSNLMVGSCLLLNENYKLHSENKTSFMTEGPMI